jgi:hypothetical protein
MGHYYEFLELVVADEVTRRETSGAMVRARAAGLDPTMCPELWDDTDETPTTAGRGPSCARCASSTAATTS